MAHHRQALSGQERSGREEDHPIMDVIRPADPQELRKPGHPENRHRFLD
jgi:hypothetical protein